MAKRQIDQKQPTEDTELVKEEQDPKRDYIFQKTNITKTGFIIILVVLVLIIIGVTLSGSFFDSNLKNP